MTEGATGTWRNPLRKRAASLGVLAALFLACVIYAVAGCSASGQAGAPQPSGQSAAGQPATRHVSEEALTRAETYDNALAGKTVEVSAEDAALHPMGDIQPASKRYTLMVYMIGSNLESQTAAATSDMQEMLGSGVDFSQVNVVVYAGGAKRWNTDIPAKLNSVLDMARPEGDRIVAQTESGVSMGAPQTLASFVNFCAEHYPAEHAALVFWDHGGGPLWGYGYDEVNGGDSLLLPELRQAMEQTSYAAGGTAKLDWVGFDACLMGSIESAALWKDYAGWMVASEEVEPGGGWDYAFLSTVGETADPKEIGNAIVTSYADYYERTTSEFSHPDITLALYDLAKADAAVGALDALLNRLGDSLDEGAYGQVNRARRSTKMFGLSATGTRAAGYDLIDLGDLAANMHDLCPDEADRLVGAIGDLVAGSSTNMDRTSGVSIYFPGENRELFETYSQLGALSGHVGHYDPGISSSSSASTSEDAAGAEESYRSASGRANDGSAASSDASGGVMLSPAYERFVEAYADEWYEFSSVDWTFAAVESSDGGLALKLSDDQAAALSQATYTVLRESNPGTYFVYTADVAIHPDGDNYLHVPADPLVIASATDIGRAVPGPFRQVEETGGGARYVNDYLRLCAAADFTDTELLADRRVSASVRLSGDEVVVESINVNDDSVGVGGKGTVDVSRYSHLEQSNVGGGGISPSYDEYGTVLPWDEWKSGGYMWMVTPLEKSFSFIARPASYFGGTWACQIVLTDANGDKHALAPVLLEGATAAAAGDSEIVQDTDLGTLKFTIIDNHVELTRYEGDDWTIEIPSEVEGLPVTSIGNDAFQGCRYLDELVVPEGVTSIGASAFAGSGLYEITLPSTLEHVAPAAFTEMEHLEQFKLSGASRAVSVKGGVLFSADGKTLIAYPNAKGDAYAVPQGTEAIGYGAFARTGVQHVTFPEGLLVIDRAAFFDCKGLSEIELPGSLREIGALAYGASSFDSSDVRSSQDTIVIGPDVSYIGERAFSGLALAAIQVDPANERYSSRGGSLMNAAGDVLIEAPHGTGATVVVPEGTVSLGSYVFYDFPQQADFVVPASVESCEPTSFPFSYADIDSNERVYSCTIHAPEGSYAERLAEAYGIAHDTTTDPALLVHERVTVEQGTYTMLFWVYADHAVLMSVNNSIDSTALDADSEHTLAIPDQVNGVPVTAIDLGRDYIEGSIEDDFGGIEALVLPPQLAKVGSRGLTSFYLAKRFELSESNEHFRIVDGALVTVDGKTLVAFPCRVEGDFAVPDGVRVIAAHAFQSCDLSSVELPDSVEEIGENAFYSCYNLERVSFGSGLETIGDEAFSSCTNLVLDAPLPPGVEDIGDNAFFLIAGFEGFELPEGIEAIGSYAFGQSSSKGDKALGSSQGALTIGRFLEKIGRNAFIGLAIDSFEVDDENEAFRAEGPFLLSADGQTLVAFAPAFAGEAHVPDSVKSLDAGLFATSFGLTDLYIPSTVARLSGDFADLAGGDGKPNVTIHVESGSYAERYAREKELSWQVD